MTGTLGYSKYDWKNKDTDNSRNGHSKKTVRSQFGEIMLDIPRDVKGKYEPAIVKKHEKTFSNSLEDMIISRFARGTSNRDIEAQMKKLYGVDVSPEMVSRITDKILPMAKEWQNRGLQELYPIIFLDGVMFNVRSDGQVGKKTAYVVFAINTMGMKEVLGIWIGEAESSKFWMNVLTDLRNRGVKDILIASVDGLNGFEEATRIAIANNETCRQNIMKPPHSPESPYQASPTTNNPTINNTCIYIFYHKRRNIKNKNTNIKTIKILDHTKIHIRMILAYRKRDGAT